MKQAFIAVDGASKGNPGHAGIGVVIRDETGTTLCEIGEYIGKATNNFAEYTALLRALSEALALGFTHASVQTDSELMAKQINGVYKVKNESIKPLFAAAQDLLAKFKRISVKHVYRESNKDADKLASAAAFSAGKPTKESVAGKEEQTVDDSGASAPETPQQTPSSVEQAPPPQPAPRATALRRRVGVRSQSRCEFVDITTEVEALVAESGVVSGVCTVFIPHTTAGVTINENADPDVTRDMIDILGRLVPRDPSYRHAEGNSDAHVKASMMGSSVQVLIEKRKLLLGTWQAIYFCEFDGPRNRHAFVRIDL